VGNTEPESHVSSEEDDNAENVTSNSRVHGNFNPTSNLRTGEHLGWVSSEEDDNAENVTSNRRAHVNFNPTSNLRTGERWDWINPYSNNSRTVNLPQSAENVTSNSRVPGNFNPTSNIRTDEGWGWVNPYSNYSRSVHLPQSAENVPSNRSSTAGVDHEAHGVNWVNLSSEGTEDNTRTKDLPPSYQDLFGENKKLHL